MHHNAHRFSIEWARVEPAPGRFDLDALAHYVDVVRTCRRHGMEPVVTLQHFTLPVWLADAGGFAAPEAPIRFARYAAACVGSARRHGHVVGDDQRTDGGRRPRTSRGTVAARRAIDASHPGRVARPPAHARRGRAGDHDGICSPRTTRAGLDRASRASPRAARSRRRRSIERSRSCPTSSSIAGSYGAASRDDAPPGRALARWCPGLPGSLTYLGVNHYTSEAVSLDLRAPGMLFARHEAVPGLPLSGAAAGRSMRLRLRLALTDLWQEFRLPILITENGVADDHDELRPAFLRDHLNAVVDAIGAGRRCSRLPVLDSMGQLRVGRGIHQAFRTVQRRPRDPGTDRETQRGDVR